MATVTTPTGERLEDVNGDLLAYYQGEAATVPGYVIDGVPGAGQAATAAEEAGPRVFTGDPQPQHEIDEALASVEQQSTEGDAGSTDPADVPAEPDAPKADKPKR